MKFSKKNYQYVVYCLLIFLIIFLSNLNDVWASETEPDNITFLAFGHIYVDYDALASSISLISKENPDFIVFLGDTLNYPGDETWSPLKQIFDRINVPVYFVPGNHDIEDSIENREYFKKNIAGELFKKFTIKNNTFIILNSISLEKPFDYDISSEQIDFLKPLYETNENKFIFMHHCLFYKDNNQLCNRRGNLISEDSAWNSKIVPLIQNKTLAIFVGDVGIKQPYFSYKENEIDYFGVGFSPDRLKIPAHMLKIVIKGESFSVTPIPLRQNLAEIKYELDTTIYSRLKLFVVHNLKLVFKFIMGAITLLLIVILSLLFKIKNKK